MKEVSSESVVKDIRHRTRKKYSSEEKIRIVLDGLRGEDSEPKNYRCLAAAFLRAQDIFQPVICRTRNENMG
jgi:hypothetical protein